MKAITKIVPVQAAASSSSRIYATSEVRLSMYLVPPVGEITVEELELYAIDRLKGNRFDPQLNEFSDFSHPLGCSVERD
jgi:hypothetical protein